MSGPELIRCDEATKEAEPVSRPNGHACHVSCCARPAPSTAVGHLKRWARKMIRIRYSEREVEVAGSPAELRSVASRLARLANVGGEDVMACDAGFDPKPYTALLSRLQLSRKEGKDRVSISSDQLELSGSSEALIRFASFFDMSDDAVDGFHVHHEFLSNDGFVAPDSWPLIVTIERQKPNQPSEPTPAAWLT